MISLPIIILGGIFVFGDYYFFRQDRMKIRETYVMEQEEIFRNEVNKAVNYINWISKRHDINRDEQKKEILMWFSRIRFSNKGRLPGFLFVRSYDGVQLMSISRPDLIGKDISLYTDPDGINTHELMMKIIKRPEGGFADYSWFNPATRTIDPKRSFVRGIPEFEWYVGAGFWFGDINRVIFQKKAELANTIKNQITTVALLLVAMFLMQYLVYRVMIRKISSGFSSFMDFFRSATTRSAHIAEEVLYYSEFVDMAASANLMIEARNQAENELRNSEGRYRSIIENIEEGYSEVDRDGNIIFFNNAMCEISGYAREELQGMNSSELLSEEDVKRVFKHYADVYNADKPQAEFTYPIIRKDGSKKYIGVTPTVIRDKDGNKVGLRSIVRDVDRQKKYEKNLIYLAYHDALTGMKNRKAFYEQLQDAVDHAKRYGTEIALIYIDIDKFKKVNDTLGHEIGDALLLEVKERLQNCLRKTDFVSRIGGDEFVVIVDNPHHIHPVVIAEKIVTRLSEPYDLKGNIVDYISSSVGISIFPNDAVDMDSLVKKADQAMYKAKEERNRYFSYADMRQ